ncbi:MAG: energy-coupling factor ABC transporter ATP-binding protein [Chloroflexi bacterium]|nr:MAG: energy-coupling factor ABC transporter ATP-binding protein [Chloroflexota bacterium]
MIQIEELHFKYIGRKAEALQGINLHILPGETVLLLGPSGSGKSSLALTLNGLIPHIVGGRMSGGVRVAGLDCDETAVSALTQQVGIVFQDPEAQFVTMTVEDEITFGLENLRVPPAEMDARIDEALAQVELSNFRRRRVDTLSGGEKQRLALAALLAMRPKILVFDEPTANLDPVGTRQLFEAIARLKETGKYTILVIEHKLDDLMHLIDRVVVLTADGALFAEGKPQTIFDKHAEALLAQGIWMPQTAILAHQIRQKGVKLHPFPLTITAAESALRSVAQSFSRNGQTPLAAQPYSEQMAVVVRDLSFRYGNTALLSPIGHSQARGQALNNINLRVPKGDFLAIVGANGAGKTTLAQHLIDVLEPPVGSIFLDGDDVTTISSRKLIRRVGYVFQNPEHQFITNSVAHEVGFGLRLMGKSEAEIESRTTSLLTQFGLIKLAKANPFTLSHGEKRRLSVATMLAVGQEILILDEPTFGQDQRNATALMQILKELHAAGRTVIIITHDMTLVAEYAQHVAVMAAGNLLFHGETAVAFAQPQLLKKARLTLPPLAELSQQLATSTPALGNLYTVRQFLDRVTEAN